MEFLMKNFDYLNEKIRIYTKNEDEENDPLYFYDWKKFFNFLIKIRSQSQV